MITRCRAPLKRPDLQGILNKLAALLIKNETHLWITHIPGKENIIADKLSRYAENPLAGCKYSLTSNGAKKVQHELQAIADYCYEMELDREILAGHYKKFCIPNTQNIYKNDLSHRTLRKNT
ncbi:MAG: hypothetical protein GY938_18470 [Ketobacter sp.]|nr:hypothetical protein [Ketobacter sp.]